jgi:hypothetical protein
VIESPTAATTIRASSGFGIRLLRDLLRDPLVLVDDVVTLSSRDDLFDLRKLVAWVDREEVWVAAKLFVFGSGHADALNAVGVAALADEVERLVVQLESLGEILDPFVHLSKDGLVQPDT